jgi:oligopeptide transport system permease protein
MNTAAVTTPSSPLSDGWRRWRKNRAAVISLWFLIFMTLSCLLLPLLWPDALTGPTEAIFRSPGEKATISLRDAADPTLITGTQEVRFFLGSDSHGHDLLYRVLRGAQVSLLVGLAAALVNLLIGVSYGLISGYLGGRVDTIMMRLVDLFYAVPRILLIMVLMSAYADGFKKALDALRLWAQSHSYAWLEKTASALLPYNSLLIVIVSLGLIEWLTMARIIRGQVLVLREQTFVLAARALGQRPWKIMLTHLLPNLWTIILTYLTLTIPSVILTESFLSFLGLGINDPAASWGSLLKDGATVINPLQSRWWLLLFPATFMASTLLALNFVGDGLRDAFDPRSRD